MPRHDIQPDGYCATCSTVPCTQRADRADSQLAGGAQLDRIEALQRRIARRLGVEVEGDET